MPPQFRHYGIVEAATHMSATILYLSTVPGDLVCGMKFAGIKNYAAARGWEAVAVPWETLRTTHIPTLLAERSPVAGCVVEYSVDGVRFPSEVFGAVPVVYLHPPSDIRNGRAAYVATDNDAVARAAFRELSTCRPSAYAVVGYRLQKEWSAVRMRVFANLAAKAHVPCHVFDDCGTDAFKRSSESMAALSRWVAALPRHTAIFAVNDDTAGEVVDAAHAAHRHIPRELSLCGVDNLPEICETKRPSITSIQIDFERAGFLAARMTDSASRRNTTVGPLMAVWRESTGGAGRREPHVMAAVERIRREACDGLTARKVIEDAPGSKRLFNLRFREAMGHSVLDEIRHVRLEKVETLLSKTDTAIGAIADMCGWGSATALERFFRAQTGMTMRDWRRKNRSQ